MNKTTGQSLVGISLNPSSLTSVDDVKQKAAELIDIVYESMQEAKTEESLLIHNEAIRQIMTAQMWSVKSITWED